MVEYRTERVFKGSWWAIVIWAILFWPVAIVYYFVKCESVTTKGG